jgi:surface antigen
MNTKYKAGLTAAALCFLLVGSSVAMELRWLNYSPVRFFTDRDWDLARAAARTALSETEDGVAIEWSNPDSGNRGTMTPLSTAERNGTRCRQLRIVNHANRTDGSAVYEFCLQPDGRWAATSGSPS